MRYSKSGLNRLGKVAKLNYGHAPIIKSNPTKLNKDTLERQEIHSIIKEKIEEGKGNIEILTLLYNKYPDSKLKKYFKQYIEYHLNKKGILNNSIKKDDDGSR